MGRERGAEIMYKGQKNSAVKTLKQASYFLPKALPCPGDLARLCAWRGQCRSVTRQREVVPVDLVTHRSHAPQRSGGSQREDTEEQVQETTLSRGQERKVEMDDKPGRRRTWSPGLRGKHFLERAHGSEDPRISEPQSNSFSLESSAGHPSSSLWAPALRTSVSSLDLVDLRKKSG